MNKILITAAVSAVLSGAAMAAGITYYHTTTVVAEVQAPELPAPVVHVDVDEQAITRDVVAGVIEAQRAEHAAKVAKAKKKDCAFWGSDFTPGC